MSHENRGYGDQARCRAGWWGSRAGPTEPDRFLRQALLQR